MNTVNSDSKLEAKEKGGPGIGPNVWHGNSGHANQSEGTLLLKLSPGTQATPRYPSSLQVTSDWSQDSLTKKCVLYGFKSFNSCTGQIKSPKQMSDSVSLHIAKPRSSEAMLKTNSRAPQAGGSLL